MKRVLAILLSVLLMLTAVPAITVLSVAAETVNYVYSGNYVYNWGQREVLATFLSPMAEDFYAENGVTYTALSSLPGASSTSDVPYSALYDALHELMYGNLDNPTSYNDTRPLFQYTDCENSGGAISSFYSGKAIGPAWDGGATWNREHTWPNSKSNGKSDTNTQRETDIMMLRPASVSENSSRGNTAYGEGSSFYHPNKEGNGTYDLRGDVSRIVLYVYVCWGGSDQHDGALNYMWGSSGVIESKEILLKWMEEDPVDTWELGRNDSVESITGTRNVFVDYPELAFLLFNEDVPDDYDSPSGESASVGGCSHNYVGHVTTAATCDKNGVKTYTCSLCGGSYTQVIPANGHTLVGGACSVCGKKQENVIFTMGKDGSASHNDGTSATTYDEKVDGYTLNIVSGNKMYTNAIDAKGNGCIKLGTSSAIGSFSFTVPNEVASVVIHVAKYKANASKVQVGGKTYSINSSSNDGKYDAIEVDTSVNKTVNLSTVSGGVRVMVNAIEYVIDIACTHSYDNACDTDCNVCGAVRTTTHDYVAVVIAPDCENGGYTTYTCICGDFYITDETAALGHAYANACDADCNVCGATREVGDHVYDNANDTTCNECGAIRQIAAQILSGGNTSVSEDVNGLAFLFTANVSGGQIENGYEYVVNSASVIPFVGGESYPVVRMGAVISNGVSSVDVEAKYLWEVAKDTASFAIRIINIPDANKDTVITARPYYVYEVDGEEIVVYGDAVSKTYNAAAQ